MIVVGSVNNHGILSDFSLGGPELSVWAPGENIMCATKPIESGTNRPVVLGFRSGTSFSAPMVAGLAAYLLSLNEYRTKLALNDVRKINEVPKNVKALILSLAYPRPSSTLPVIYNGYKPPIPPRSSSSSTAPDACSASRGFQKREACSCEYSRCPVVLKRCSS